MAENIERRTLLQACAATATALACGSVTSSAASAAPAAGATDALDAWTAQTLEAFADTLIPGARRHPGDRAIAGVVTGPGAVQAGAVEVMTSPELPLCPLLPEVGTLLNTRASTYALRHLILLPIGPPPFVGLSFPHRTGLVSELFQPDDLDRDIWSVLSLVACLAFDTAAHLGTRQAISAGHPGLAWIGFPAPGPDGLWRFPEHSYGRPLASLHPSTTASGSPA